MEQISAECLQFINDHAEYGFSSSHWASIYGKDNVEAWFKDPAVQQLMRQKRAQISKRQTDLEEKRIKDILSRRDAAFKALDEIIKDPTHKDRFAAAKSMIQYELDYLSAKAKAQGMAENAGKDPLDFPKLRLVVGADETEL